MAVPFTKHEAALLLNIYLEGERCSTPRYASARRCSVALRQMAISQGRKIDNTYRSVNGITNQIARMESAYKGRTIMKPATQLFIEIVKTYRNNQKSYDKLLEEAKRMAEVATEKDTVWVDDTQCVRECKNAFLKWMRNEQHMAEATCRGYVSAIHRAETYAVEHGLASGKLYTLDLQKATAMAEALFQDAEFRQYNAKQHNSFTAAIKKLLTFLGSNWAPVAAEFTSDEGKDCHMIPKNLLMSIQQYYGGGMRFDDTVLRLLEERSGAKISKETETILRNSMFCRSDGLYFLPEMLGSKEQHALLDRQSLLEKIANFGCVNLCALYSDFCSYSTETCIRNEDDLADYLMFSLPKDIRIASALRTKIIRKIGISKHETLEQSADKVVRTIKKSGCITQDDLLLLFPVFSELFLHGLLEKYTDEIIPTKINDFLCYQTIESMGLEPDFSSVLNDVLKETDRLSLPLSQDIIHAVLSVRLGYNLRDEFNIPDDKTFRRIISVYYTGNPPRAWRSGSFEEVTGGHV